MEADAQAASVKAAQLAAACAAREHLAAQLAAAEHAAHEAAGHLAASAEQLEAADAAVRAAGTERDQERSRVAHLSAEVEAAVRLAAILEVSAWPR